MKLMEKNIVANPSPPMRIKEREAKARKKWE
jgi:hypothetical protein